MQYISTHRVLKKFNYSLIIVHRGSSAVTADSIYSMQGHVQHVLYVSFELHTEGCENYEATV